MSVAPRSPGNPPRSAGPVDNEFTNRFARQHRDPTDASLAPAGRTTDFVQINHQPGELKMDNSEYQRNYFKQRYANDPEFRAHRKAVSNDYRRDRYANDPEFRATCVRSSRNSRLKKQHGITLDQLEAQLAAQHGACGCCGEKLGRVIRIDHQAAGMLGLLCSRCRKLVDSLRHVRAHADAFEAYMKKWGMTAQLGRFYDVMKIMGWTPAQSEAGRN
jgi:hypothetical protein